MSKQIVNKVETKDYLYLNEVIVFQGKLKSITSDDLNKLKKSLIKSGIDICFHIWKDSKGKNQILDGTHRFYALTALKEEGYEIPKLPVVYVKAQSRKEAAKVVLISNSRYAKMTQESISDFMIDMELNLDDLEFLDIPELNMDDFNLEENNEYEGNCNPDEIPEEVPNKAKHGDLFILGEHRLLCGDSTDIATVERLMNDEKADMVFTSPPYNGDTHLDYGKGKNKKLYENNFDAKNSNEYVEFCHNVLSLCFDFCKGFIFWNVNYNAKSRFEYIKSIYPFIDSLHETIIWKKTGMPLSSGLTRNFEFIFCFKNGERKHLGKTNETNFNIWDISNINSQDKENHRACFPVALPQKGIELGSEIDQIIFEPFGGSGSTLIACEKTKRKCFMMELDPHYIDVIIQRWQNYTGKKAIRSDGALWDDIK